MKSFIDVIRSNILVQAVLSIALGLLLAFFGRGRRCLP